MVATDGSPQISSVVAKKYHDHGQKNTMITGRTQEPLDRGEVLGGVGWVWGSQKFAVHKCRVESYFQNYGYCVLDMVHNLSF